MTAAPDEHLPTAGLEFHQGLGTRLWDQAGREYLDAPRVWR
jgi:acetylornithine/succinyldiaminopimelate/putrescine aminotransferase